MARIVKFNLSRLIAAVLRNSTVLRTRGRRIWGHAYLAAGIRHPLPASVVVLGRPEIYGTGNIVIGSDVLLYPHSTSRHKGKAALPSVTM